MRFSSIHLCKNILRLQFSSFSTDSIRKQIDSMINLQKALAVNKSYRFPMIIPNIHNISIPQFNLNWMGVERNSYCPRDWQYFIICNNIKHNSNQFINYAVKTIISVRSTPLLWNGNKIVLILKKYSRNVNKSF